MTIRYLSVCSGIEAATQAFRPLNWKPVAFSEIEKFPCAVLAHHCPTVPNWGDMTTRIPYRGKPADKCPDGRRYKALGNSWAVNEAEWIGERIAEVDAWGDLAACV